jgi:NAD(P)-dependent dehydrogenase (short-subunit alcohol dehydrogenase family)
MNMNENANGQKVAVITGGSQGIGAGIVAGYRELGWQVLANALTIKPSQDPDVVTVEGDISQPGTTDRIMAEALSRFGRIDTLVNDAGLYIEKPFTQYTADNYASIVGVNLTGFFLLTQRVIAEMLKRGSGHVVNIATTLAEYADASRPALLAALTKGGLISATKSLAIEYASRGIRVNAVSLGVIQTALNAGADYEPLAKLHPLGRVGEVSDVVRGILFLEAAPFVTGEILHIDGGQTAGYTS